MTKRRSFDPAEIKRIALKAMFSDDDLMERLVLKGGNLLDVVFEISSRASIDLDFSIDGEFERPEWLLERVRTALETGFLEIGVIAFDVNVVEAPPILSAELVDFWGGYKVDFKIIEKELAEEHKSDPATMRRWAIAIGERGSTKFAIDISKHEYCDDKQPFDIDYLRIFTYSPEMVVCEKLRAICQQMPEYAVMVKKHKAARARDFVDIFDVCRRRNVAFDSERMKRILPKVFAAKRVPLRLLGTLADFRDFHRQDFTSVQATVKPDVILGDFDFYFDFVLDNLGSLKALWDK